MSILERFKTKKAMKAHYSRLLASYTPGQRLTAQDEVEVLALLQRHPERDQKIAAGAAWVSVEATMYGAQGFHLHRIDGSVEGFSYITAVNGKPQPHREKVIRALRYAVDDQMLAARRRLGDVATCQATGVQILPGSGHVDHAPPWTFSRILDAFMATRSFDDVPVIEIPEAPYLRITDESFAADFSAFHRERAVLRMVDKHFNMKVGGHASATCFDEEFGRC